MKLYWSTASALATAILLNSGCVYYSSRLEVGFENHGYTNSGEHNEVSLWWDSTAVKTRGVGLVYGEERHRGDASTLTIGFIQHPNVVDRVHIDTLTLLPPGKKQAVVKLLSESVELEFAEKSFPLFDAESPDGRDVLRDYAELDVSVDLHPKRRPYQLHMSGRYLDTKGSEITFAIDERIIVERSRDLTSIGNTF